MDISELNIYNKDKFILRSVLRQKQFPFIRYDGKNYDEFVSFITAASPNTKIPKPELLKIGELYTFSGKTFQLMRVPLYKLRYVIASNPYLVLSEGNWIPLAINLQQARDYLRSDRRHKVFLYEDILSTYKYTPDYSTYMVYNVSHPTGISIGDLPDYNEWFIGDNEGNPRMVGQQEVFYQKEIHVVDVRPSFVEIEDRIEGLKYEINRILNVRGRTVLFNVDWENYARRKDLRTTCLNERRFSGFAIALYKTIFEETRGFSTSQTNPIAEFVNHPIVKIAEVLGHHYGVGQESSVSLSNNEYSIDQVFLRYLEHDLGPQEPDDYIILQQGLLDDFRAFLGKVLDAIKAKMKIVGTICQDDHGSIYCGKALLAQKYAYYGGCECIITSYLVNNDKRTNKQYPFYSDKLDCVVLDRIGTICKDDEGNIFLDRFVFKEAQLELLGKKAQIKQVHPFIKITNQYLGEVLEYVLLEDVKIESLPQPSQKIISNPDPFHFEIPEDIFNKDKRVADDTIHLKSLQDAITSGKDSLQDFQKLVDYVLKWGIIKDAAEQKAMLTMLTGYNYPDASRTVRWCCDEYMPRVLYYIVKYISNDRFKYKPLERVDFDSTDDTKAYDITKDLTSLRDGSNISNTINKGIPPFVKRALYSLYPSLFPKEK